ncbi:hypothetical protein OPQ81_005080 [Rhizoctonia solani]|nr:hypothetical protein OPQ81_005080 [Rhizoctonia solani]
MPRKHSQDTINSVLSLLDGKKSFAEIYDQTKVPISTIGWLCAKHHPDHQRASVGRPRKLNPAATCYAIRLVTNQITNQNSVNTRQATQTLSRLTGESIHPKTACHALKRAGLKPKKGVKKPKLTKAHIKAQLEFAKAHRFWTVEDWKRVLWSDEITLECLGTGGVHWVLTRPGEDLNNGLILPTLNFGGGSFMFWGCMGWNGTGFGAKLERKLNSELYVEILGDEFLKSLAHLGLEQEEVIFMHDHPRPHKAKIVGTWLEDNGIDCVEWPANSPDLNPIENLWAELKRRLGEYENAPAGMLGFWDRVQDVWDDFAEEYFQKLIKSMPRCMTMVIEKKGGSIPY